MNWEVISTSFSPLLAAVPNTLLLVSSSVSLGLILAMLIASMRLSDNLQLSRLAYFYVYIFRSSPALVQIFLIYYGSGQFRDELTSVGLWQFFREPWFCAILALMLNTAAYSSEVIRGGMESVPHGLIEAAKAYGMNRWQRFRLIIMPLAIRQMLPAYGNEIILMMKATSLASTITIMEITGVAKQLISESFRPLEIFLVAGCIYLILNFIIIRIVQFSEQRLNQHLR